jgi:alpha-amylase/alpha-mannosidase (GH57 family)
LAKRLQPVSAIHVPYPISWADEERDITAWLGNDLQDETFDRLYSLTEMVRQTGDPELLRDWYYLQSSDHFYYMCTKWFSDGDVHKYFNHYPSPYEAYINYMNVLSDFIIRIEKHGIPVGKQFEEIVHKSLELGKELGNKTAKKVKKGLQKGMEKSKPVFEDIRHLSNDQIKKLAREFDTEALVIAFKDAEKELVDTIIPQLSKAAQKKYEQMQSEIQKVRKTDIARVRRQIEDKLKELF